MQESIFFEKKWRLLYGGGYGYRGSVMIGRVLIKKNAYSLWPQIKTFLVRVSGLTLANKKTTVCSNIELMEQLFRWVEALYVQQRVPLFQKSKSQILSEDKLGTSLQLFISSDDAPTTHKIWYWIAQCVSLIERSNGVPEGAEFVRLKTQFSTLLKRLSESVPKGINPYYFLKAAHELEIPVHKIATMCIRFGTGLNSTVLNSSYTLETSVLGAQLARNKALSASFLEGLGLPVPEHFLVHSEDHAVKCAADIGYPVVVKPADLDGGKAVAADLPDENLVRMAYREAISHSTNILVEKFYAGKDYRFTVFRDQVVKVIYRQPGGVVGDGKHQISELVAMAARDSDQIRRSQERFRFSGVLLKLDEEALSLLSYEGKSVSSIPDNGEFVKLRRNANVSTGGMPALFTGDIHRDNQRLVIRAAQAMNLDIAGVDVISEDISRSWLEAETVICEVNGCPQIGAGSTPDIYKEILNQLVSKPCRMKLAVVIGSSPSGAFSHLVDIAKKESWVFGYASSKGVWKWDEQLSGRQKNGFDAASILLSQNNLSLGIIHLRPSDIIGMGVPFDWCDVVMLENTVKTDRHSEQAFLEMLRLISPHVKEEMFALNTNPALAMVSAESGLTITQLNTKGVADDNLYLASEAAKVLNYAEK